MASLRDLVRTLLPLAQLVGVEAGDDAGLDREVFWVRLLRAREPAVDSLEAGDLVIVPSAVLAAVAPTTRQATALGASFARARVAAAVVLGRDGEAGGAAADALGAAARPGGVTVLRTQDEDAPALERSIIGFIVNRRAELDRRAAALEAQLARLSLAGQGLDSLAVAIGSFLGPAIPSRSTPRPSSRAGRRR
jgi:hypothetical protein